MEKMFCFQCQEAAKGKGCTARGVCGKPPEVAGLQDLTLYLARGLALYCTEARRLNLDPAPSPEFIAESLFATITNASFSEGDFQERIKRAVQLREELKEKIVSSGLDYELPTHPAATWTPTGEEEYQDLISEVGVLRTENPDIRSLRELLTYGLKGMAAYLTHARVLGYDDPEISTFLEKALAETLDDSLSADDLTALVLRCGEVGAQTMALLDQANTSTYGHPEITSVNIGVGSRPGILISGHDLRDMEELLEQTSGTGIDVYTHSEMLPAHYYPAFKKYEHFQGNYGNSWWQQNKEFQSFNGPILMTTNCITPVKEGYRDRLFTTGVARYPDCEHIEAGPDGKKDFSPLIEKAKQCPPPTEIETGEIVGGFAHQQVLALADKVVEAVKSGAIRQFFVMAGCDGRMKSREYYNSFARQLPANTVILTAGCAKYRYNKLGLGDIGGIPRVLDAGQCNDSYSLVVIAQKLKEVMDLDDLNQLPISFNIAWYEQKAVIVLLALLALGIKNIKVGPTLPAFLSPGVTGVLQEKFGLQGITDVEQDLEYFLG